MTTKHTGLIGYPVSHSLSPRIHRYWIDQYGLDATYELFPTSPETLEKTINDLRRDGVAGFNVTVPHKEKSMKFLDAFDVTAQRIGAVNTVTLVHGIFHCTNTDAYGFINNLKSSQEWTESALKKVVILGAGGAARAAIVALKDSGCEYIVLCNRTDEKAAALAAEFHTEMAPWSARSDILADTTLLVNATSLGMVGKEELEIDLYKLYHRSLVHDIIYAPLVTPLLAAARSRGNPTIDGLGMLLYQAQAAFAQWHGITPEVTPELRAHVLGREANGVPRSGAED